jgi:uncharacterized membrane protein
MMPEKVIYTDGHDVTVTDTTLQVKKQEYNLNGVMNCGMSVIRPQRAPGIVLLVLGIGLIIAGVMKAINPSLIPDTEIGEKVFSANTLALWVGGVIALIGLLVLGLVRERYALRIITAEGEKDAVVSDRSEYIHQIVDAINQAISFMRGTDSREFTVRSTT